MTAVRSWVVGILFTFVCIVSSSAFGQSISIAEVVGLLRNDTVRTSTPLTFKLRYSNPEALNMMISNGYEIYSPDGATWNHAAVAGDTLNGAIPRSNWDIQFSINVFLGSGVPPRDTVGIIGAKINTPGMPGGFDGIPYAVKIGAIDDANDGLQICLDSAWFRPGGTWKWTASGGIQRFPSWGGPFCYHIYKVPDLLPNITNAPASLSGRHCVTMSYDFNGLDPEAEAVTFEKVSGPGTINATTGLWSYSPSINDVGQALTLVVRACEAHGCGTSISVPLTFTNEVPSFTSGCNTTLWVTLGGSVTKDMNGSDGCSDALHFSLGGVTPALDGTVSINASSGLITFATNAGAALGDYDVTVYVADIKDSTSCHTYFKVSAGCCQNYRGNANGDPQDRLDISDIVFLVDYLFRQGPAPVCRDEANVDASPDQVIDISDLTYIVSYIFFGGPVPPMCP